MKRVLITGGSGFIGTHYARRLLNDGCVVYNLDVVEPRFEHERYFFIRQDVRALSECNIDDIDIILNFAAIHTTPGHPCHEYYETNVSGANEICALAERNGIKEIVFTSSISVYGPDEGQKDESTVLTPNSAYGYSKMLAEKIHQSWLKRNEGAKLTIVRPAVVFGPGEGGNFTRLATMLCKGGFVYPGRKDTIKSCIYVEDLIHAIEQARATGNRYELFNGAYTERYTLEQIIETFRTKYYPNAKTIMIPKFVVISAAKLLGMFNFLNIGIHPERVMKLIKSTNIYPTWLVANKVELPGDLSSALERWSDATNGKFD